MQQQELAVAVTTTRPGVIGLISDDLPCPWCGEATAEYDDHCTGCGRRFG
ncbi:MAG: hypothetical protein ACLGHX_14555 [Acidimicrobiia bacterium]